jgi:hypothetical protein
MLPSSSIGKGQNLCRVALPTYKNFDRQRRGGTVRCHSLVPHRLSGGRRPRTTAHPSVFAMLAFKNLDDREVAEIA